MFRNSSLLLRFSGLFIFVLGLLGTAYYVLLRDVYHAELRRQATSIADNVEAFGKWVAQYGRVWVKDKPETAHLSRVEFGDHVAELAKVPGSKPANALVGIKPVSATSSPTVAFYSKNPALAQREFSEVVAQSPSRAKFRMTSDNWMAQQNRPDSFELEAIAMIKNRNLNEYISIANGQYRYARKIVHTAACIACHGSADAAPKEVVERYGKEHGFGFAAGDVAGIISVTLPTDPLLASSLRMLGPVAIGLVLIAFIILYAFMFYGVVRPIKNLTADAHRISVGERVVLETAGLKKHTRSEVGALTLAIARLHASLQLSVQKVQQLRREKDQKTD